VVVPAPELLSIDVAVENYIAMPGAFRKRLPAKPLLGNFPHHRPSDPRHSRCAAGGFRAVGDFPHHRSPRRR
jgi:hypothetical protein